MNDFTAPILPFAGKDIRPRTLGAPPLVSAEKLNQIIRELNRDRRAPVSNHQLNGIVQGQGEVILRGGREGINTISSDSRQRRCDEIKEFIEGESVTADRLNEIVNALNEDIIGCPLPARVDRPYPNPNVFELDGVTTFPNIVGNLPGGGPFNKTSSNQYGTDAIRVWYKFPEPLDMFDVLVNESRNEWYEFSATINDPYGNMTYGPWYVRPILVTQSWDIKSISHSTAPGSSYLYRGGLLGNNYSFQPTRLGSGKGIGFDINNARKFYCVDMFSYNAYMPVEVYLDSGNTNLILNIFTGLSTIAVNQLKGMSIYYGGVRAKVFYNTATTIYLETPLDDIPPGGFTPVYFYPIVYGFYLFLGSGSDYTNAGCRSISKMTMERYPVFIGDE